MPIPISSKLHLNIFFRSSVIETAIRIRNSRTLLRNDGSSIGYRKSEELRGIICSVGGVIVTQGTFM